MDATKTIPQHATDAVLRTLTDHARGARAIADALTRKAPQATALIDMHREEQKAFELLSGEVASGLLERAESKPATVVSPYLDQRAAAIREQREGQPVAGGAVRLADHLARQLPELDRATIGAVVLLVGAAISDSWKWFENDGMSDAEILPHIACLVDVTGEYLYAPPPGSEA